MCDGYDAAGEDDRPELEDEFLCEYVDGTMDPVVREVFEEYLRANPGLQDHIECLRHTRLLLCRYGCRCHAPRDLHDRLRRQITCDLVDARIPFHILVADRLTGAAFVSSAMVLLLLIGILGGLTFVDTIDQKPSMASAAVVNGQKLAPAPGATYDAAESPSAPFMRVPRLSPREVDPVWLGAGRSIVAHGLEYEIGARASFASVVDRTPVFP